MNSQQGRSHSGQVKMSSVGKVTQVPSGKLYQQIFEAEVGVFLCYPLPSPPQTSLPLKAFLPGNPMKQGFEIASILKIILIGS